MFSPALLLIVVDTAVTKQQMQRVSDCLPYQRCHDMVQIDSNDDICVINIFSQLLH